MEKKVDWVIVRSILVASWLNVIICAFISILIIGGFYLYNKGAYKAREENTANARTECMNDGGCWINNRCQNPCVGRW